MEGLVSVSRSKKEPGERAVIIGAGNIALSKGRTTLLATNSAEAVENGLSWRSGILTFENTTLSEAAAEFNRYNFRKLIVVDPTAAAIRIGGTFEASNVDAFARLIGDAYGLKIRRQGDRLEIIGTE